MNLEKLKASQPHPITA